MKASGNGYTNNPTLSAVLEAAQKTDKDEFLSRDLVEDIQTILGRRLNPRQIGYHLKELERMGAIKSRKYSTPRGTNKGSLIFTLPHRRPGTRST